jgi:integrase
MLRQIVRVSRFWREYAEELAVDAIDDKVMREFIPWSPGLLFEIQTTSEER